MLDDSRVLASVTDRQGRLTVNRPAALNALDLGMVRELADALERWEAAASVDVVIVKGAGGRGLSAGGDVRHIAQLVAAGTVDDVIAFFREEYALNARIAEYGVPVVAFADGVTMGGGIGLAGHAFARVVTEHSRLAMPETRIGFTPDVGGTWLLSRAPGRVGEYLALTGATMDAADAVFAGFADVVVPSDQLPGLEAALAGSAQPADVRSVIDRYAVSTPPSGLSEAQAWIDEVFSAESVSDIVERLHGCSEPGAAASLEILRQVSPTALAVTLQSVRRARTLPSLRAALAKEYGIVMWFVRTQQDFTEGVRAQLVEKDRSPRWVPATIDQVTPASVTEALEYAPSPALWAAVR